ncbi:SPV032 putative PKR inhibitor host range protein [Swinepox virus]|uniref:SPV032 putative PKR inhibitor host range protein n=1 Tax=Swinepox virus (strain Swine/Nebraska/17077-99/1999) TaxID=300880 RepID=Q8V3R2_SWPV1|nr:double-strand RNA-binding protein [Swinepox virus]AAL69771.1 SPV032 putative PKR inhibitor host range protein [Swinepox virus]UED36634.1 double-strand RNA-binding protein [Swinepox virus]UED36783.1 double-strand RNA-binding protein [Swinepox virus]UUA44222.1 SPV032 [Swinepox virus]
MCSDISNEDVYSLVKQEVDSLPVGNFITAVEISKKIEKEKSSINRQLYALYQQGYIDMVPACPPKWYKRNQDNMNNESIEIHNPDHMFSDTIPYTKIIEWKNKNPITVLNEYCQITQRDWIIDIISSGQSHCPIFTASITVSGIKCKTGKGSTKKEAKQIAARETMNFILNKTIIKF